MNERPERPLTDNPTTEIEQNRRDALVKLLRVTGYCAPATLIALSMKANAEPPGSG